MIGSINPHLLANPTLHFQHFTILSCSTSLTFPCSTITYKILLPTCDRFRDIGFFRTIILEFLLTLPGSFFPFSIVTYFDLFFCIISRKRIRIPVIYLRLSEIRTRPPPLYYKSNLTLVYIKILSPPRTLSSPLVTTTKSISIHFNYLGSTTLSLYCPEPLPNNVSNSLSLQNIDFSTKLTRVLCLPGG